MMFLRRKRIRVQFIDADSEAPCGFTELLRADIPKKLGTGEPVEISGARYIIVRLNPENPRLSKGALEVWIRPASGSKNTLVKTSAPSSEVREETKPLEPAPEMVVEEPAAEPVMIPVAEKPAEQPPVPSAGSDSVYRSISSRINRPHPGTQKPATQNVAALDPAEWRQLEFIVTAQESTVREEFDAIRAFRMKDQESEFTRNRIILPLDKTILTIGDITEKYFTGCTRLEGLVHKETGTLLQDVLVVRAPGGFLVYGKHVGDFMFSFGIGRKSLKGHSPLPGEISLIRKMMEEHKLMLVDWEHLKVVGQDEPSLKKFFS